MVERKNILGRDIKLNDKGDISFNFNQDFNMIEGQENLAQALKNRLNTGNNELSYYDNYGSRLLNLIGAENTILNRNEARGYISESVINDPRVLEIVNTNVVFKDKQTIETNVTIVSIDDNNEKNLVFNVGK